MRLSAAVPPGFHPELQKHPGAIRCFSLRFISFPPVRHPNSRKSRLSWRRPETCCSPETLNNLQLLLRVLNSPTKQANKTGIPFICIPAAPRWATCRLPGAPVDSGSCSPENVSASVAPTCSECRLRGGRTEPALPLSLPETTPPSLFLSSLHLTSSIFI